ncbi:MAG: ribonuclease H-like domain-containing protein, partial [Patescibacteria group bacterium]|nr:ribonuclease H-like domain-containing protein [Patescibacteria group bacterium]
MRRIVETRELVNAFTDYKTNKLVLVGRNAQGEVSYKPVNADYSSFVKKDSLTPDIERMLRNSNDVIGFTEDNEYYRIRWKDYDSRKWANENLPKKGVKTYDGDVSAIRRFITDTAAKPGKPRSVFLDIETDSKIPFSQKEKARIFCWVLVDAETKEVYKAILEEDTDDAEQWLLVRFWQVLQNYDQVIAWNGDRFDFPMVKERSKLHGLTTEPRRWLWLDFLELFKRMNTMAAESGEEKRSYTLNAVANTVLGHGKLEFDSSKTREAYDNTNYCPDGKCMKCRKCLLDYCVQDTVLMPELEAKKGFINVFHTLCDVCSVFPDSYGINPSVQVEGFLRNIAKEKGFKFVTRLDRRAVSTDQYKGAFVLHPVRAGMIKNVHVCDFASLYPSIIITWNISPETKVSEPTEYCCVAPITNRYFDISKEGILPFAVNELIRLRKEWQKREKECAPNTPEWHEAHARSTAYKIAANSFYGVVGSPMSPFFDRDVAEAVTQCGVWLIQNVIYEGSKRDMPALAGDTDSSFIVGPTTEKFADFVFNYCNGELIPRLVDACGCRENRIKLDYDKAFE